MMTRTVRTLALALIALPATLAGQLDSKAYPQYTKLFAVDTVGHPVFSQLSPSGRWVAMAINRGEGSAIFLGRVGTKELVRVTDDGHDDGVPLWFPSGDRLAFISDRPDRDGVKNRYGMVIDIDPSSGRPRSAPRQVTLDSASIVQPTPDGQWLAVSTAGNPNVLELVPAAGGTARTLVAPAVGRAVHMGFTPDGQAVTYLVRRPRNDFTIERVALNPPGAKPDTLMKSPVAAYLLGADQRFVVLDPTGDSARIQPMKRLDGTLVGSIPLAPRMNDAYKTADGRGYMVTLDTGGGHGIAVTAAGGSGQGRTISMPKLNTYPVGWLADGSAVVSVGDPNSGHAVKMSAVHVTPVDGGASRTFPLKDAVFTPHIGVLGNELVYAALVAQPGDTSRKPALMAIDLRTGLVRTVSSNLAPRQILSTAGFVGMPRDRAAWAERVGQEVSVYSERPGERPQLLHTFQLPFPTPDGIYVNGQRLLWADARGDSTAIMITDNPTAAPRLLAMFPGADKDLTGGAWSHDGKRLAITKRTDDRSTLYLYDVPVGAAAPKPRVIQLEGAVFETGWLPGDEALVAEGLFKPSKEAVVRISASTGMVTILNREDPRQLSEAFAVSPDGKRIAYSFEGGGTGTIIYRTDFTTLIPRGP
jgi:Tol biopolymer transport system component